MTLPATPKIAIIGLGYVGLPLAVEFGKKYPVTGFDIKQGRIDELKAGRDSTREVEPDELAAASQLSFTADPEQLRSCNVFIVTVPTPVDNAQRPDLTPLIKASETVGKVMPQGAIVIYESTVYPGATEEVCVPILEKHSGLSYFSLPFKGRAGEGMGQETGQEMGKEIEQNIFHCGYSPERINPGDKQHRLPTIKKVTSGSTPEIAEFVDTLYRSIITAGTHKASSIKVAEAAKVIENTQRDLNIALMNELSLIFHRLGIDTLEVLEAAGSKWNFLPFRPGLVGGHCIGVDPYYLTHKAQEIGYHPEVILAGRRINDSMAGYVADEVVKLMTRRKMQVVDSRILVLGLTFKEGCPDLRNTKVIDVVRELTSYHAKVDIYDPWIDVAEAEHEYRVTPLKDKPQANTYDAIILAVAHPEFLQLGAAGIHAYGKAEHVLYDVKSLLEKGDADGRL
ncbi:nucleotide sugar dehydrogenase [Sulfuritalea sp.]|uniref:nucleotide sugar dehydrogenase n=1 Tax=Sulfuritalea sp. TaxID=2480090 RepID=UPI00286D9F19|nr:nucleotide sugar dehydrogenase [Sulfuritalea sp.]